MGCLRRVAFDCCWCGATCDFSHASVWGPGWPACCTASARCVYHGTRTSPARCGALCAVRCARRVPRTSVLWLQLQSTRHQSCGHTCHPCNILQSMCHRLQLHASFSPPNTATAPLPPCRASPLIHMLPPPLRTRQPRHSRIGLTPFVAHPLRFVWPARWTPRITDAAAEMLLPTRRALPFCKVNSMVPYTTHTVHLHATTFLLSKRHLDPHPPQHTPVLSTLPHAPPQVALAPSRDAPTPHPSLTSNQPPS